MFKRLQRRILIAALMLTTTTLAVAAIEFPLRALCPLPQQGYGTWAGTPGSRQTLISAPDRFSTTHRYNRFGFRGGDFPIERQGDLRVVCVGDSFTEGIGAEEDQAWPAAAKNHLDGIDVEVLNLGRAGADPKLYAEIIAAVALALQPTDLIVCLIPSDLLYTPEVPERLPVRERFPDEFFDERPPVGRRVARLAPGWTYLVDRVQGRWPCRNGNYWHCWSTRDAEQAIEKLMAMSGVSRDEAHRLIAERISHLYPELLAAAQRGEFNPGFLGGELVRPDIHCVAELDDMLDQKAQIVAGTRHWLNWFADTCRARGIRPWLLYFPLGPLVSPGSWGVMREEFTASIPQVAGNVSIRNFVREVCADYGVAFIDATQTLRAHRHEVLYHKFDMHPTPRGYELVGRHVANEIRSTLTGEGSSSRQFAESRSSAGTVDAANRQLGRSPNAD
ncbi:MAG: hypothetical protein EXS05_07935 [Planctomycetaceae bacterium]|nr:hypothetical protein [Planctomycetaceae bacterium]